MIDLPHQPVFVAPYRDVPGGVDYLGLRAVNLDLMNQFLPGINNVTKEIRPYSVACWIVWSFANQASAQGMTEVHPSDFRAYREKAEVLFNWSHTLSKDDAGMFGNAQVRPDGATGIPLTFEEWKRNVSWFDAVAYGPSLKTDNGLGFIKQVYTGLFAVTQQGEELAKSLDQQLRGSEAYSVLVSLDAQFVDVAIAEALYEAWRRGHCSKGERTVFRRAFYDPNEITSDNRNGNRSAAITLLYATIKDTDDDLTEAQVRRALVLREPTNLPVDQLDQLRSARANWQVLQVRQAHRLALEVLFGWLEWQVLVNGLKTSGQLVETLLAACDEFGPVTDATLDLQQAVFRPQLPSVPKQLLVEQIDQYPDLDFFSHMERLLITNKDDRNQAASMAVRLLLLCATLADDLKQDERASRYLEQGGSLRVSLNFWSDFVRANSTMRLAEFVLILVENFLLSQHFGFAAARYSEGKLRLRVTIEDTGLVSLLPGADKVWTPIVTLDRLDSALSLMANSGLIKRDVVGGEFHYSV